MMLLTKKYMLSIKDKSEFTAGMIGEGTHSFEVMNPELVICTMDPTARLDIEITIGQAAVVMFLLKKIK